MNGDGREGSAAPRVRRRFTIGLIAMEAASTILTTTFGIFHVDTFLTAYRLPLESFARGNFYYAFFNVANDVGGAWLVDSMAARSSRSGLIGASGVLFALCFLTPFFRWGGPRGAWDTAHFVTSISLYDTMFSFCCILQGSMFADNHDMSEDDRIGLMAAGKFMNMVISFAVARIGLAYFDAGDMSPFRGYVAVLAALSSAIFVLAQGIMRSGRGRIESTDVVVSAKRKKPTKPLDIRQVARDLASHGNFRAWIAMEALMECQGNFRSSFLKTFVDRLLVPSGLSRGGADWLISAVGPLGSVAALLAYAPIRAYGYRRLYAFLFRMNVVLSALLLMFGSPSSTRLLTTYLVVTFVMGKAVMSSGFHLAMSDMVMEMKLKQARGKRPDEASAAGMFMGANALVCKPMDSLLPILAAWSLGGVAPSSADGGDAPAEEQEGARRVLFLLLVLPPLVFSAIQHAAWRRYTLGDPGQPEEMRTELAALRSRCEVADDA